MQAPDGLLLLADGTQWTGYLLGHKGVALGELCFNTSMWGYQEIHTDPSYRGQLLVHTAPHIGNYGVCDAESESARPQVSGVVMRGYTPYYRRARAHTDLGTYLDTHKLTGIYGVDTRALVKHLASNQTMNALIAPAKHSKSELKARLKKWPSISARALVADVSTPEIREEGPKDIPCVGVLDMGVKSAILDHLLRQNVRYRLYPWNTPANQMMEVDAYLLSNGPGDPEQIPLEVIHNIQQLIATKKPLLGICLGLQLIARAYGIPTYKLPYGHRGSNHPVRRLKALPHSNGKSAANAFHPNGALTSQNHGFAVNRKAVEAHPDLVLTHEHIHDNTVAGLRVKDQPVFAVQYHPEASPGPHDSYYIFDELTTAIHKAIKK